MQFRFSFKHMDSSAALEKLARQKIEGKVMRFVTKPIETHVVFEIDGVNHRVSCSMTGGDGFNLDVSAESDDMYATIDMAADKLATQLKRQKEKLKSHKGNAKVRDITHLTRGSRRQNDADYIDAEDILKYEAALRRRRTAS